MIRTRRGIYDGIEIPWLQLSHLEGPFRGRQAQVDSGFSFAHPMPFLNPGPGPDPLVSGVQERRELLVGDDPFGDGEASSEKSRMGHAV
jgi:hypothetical protein